MIKNQWYAVLSSHNLKKNQVLGARRFGENLIFFRNAADEVSILSSLCPHRGASLEKGCVNNDHVRCPFHGIEYDISGKCVYVPSEGKASPQDYSRFHLKRYHTKEIGGIIFAWYGDGVPTTEPDIFDIITDPSFQYDHVEDNWDVQYSRVIENQLDVSHLAFVHHNTIGRGNKTVCNGPKVVWLDENTMQTSANNEVDSGQKPLSSEESVIKNTNLTFKFPNMWLNHVTDKIMILAFFIPVDEAHSIIALRFYSKITGVKVIDKLIACIGSLANIIVERQDKRIVETQLPKSTDIRMSENLVAADLPIIEYRSKRNKLQNNQNGTRADISASKLYEVRSGAVTGDIPLIMDQKAMYRLSYGLFVCTAANGEKKNSCIINTAIQAASAPNRITIAVNKSNYTHDLIKETGACNLSVLSTNASFDLFKRFGFQSGRDTDKFKDFPETSLRIADNGIPYITEGTNAVFSLKVEKELDLESHTLFVCEPVFMTVLSDEPSCTYAYYQSNIKPKPEKAGTTANGETIWRCLVCGYEYIGEEMPDDYVCPICKHGKVDFEKLTQ